MSNFFKTKKILGIFIIIGVMLSALVLPPFLNVLAFTNTKLIVNSNNAISIDESDSNKLDYKINDTLVGTVKVKIGENYMTPVLNSGKYEFNLDPYNGNTYQVSVEVTSESGYQTTEKYVFNGTQKSFLNDGNISLDITSDSVFNLDFDFQVVNNQGGNQGGGDEQPLIYPVTATFSGINNGVEMDSTGTITIPDNWTSGNITFTAKVCTNNGHVVPNDGTFTCDDGSQRISALEIQGTANVDQLNGTISGTREYLAVSSDFMNYGYALVHLTNTPDGINESVSVSSKDLITLTAEAPLNMSFSIGSTSVVQAIVTKDVTKDLSVFFGNTEAKLIARGPNVSKIIGVTGAKSVVLNNDGSATVQLPSLSVETTTQVKVTILLKDNTTVTRTVNLKRTAIMLSYNSFDKKLKAGYVMNKAYLYDNKNHDDSIFNAYLQVIIYKGKEVVGFKQVKIDDEYRVNGLEKNKATSIETFDDDAILLLNNDSGYTSASVFLTNGPLDVNSKTLPSIEFGIGSGVSVNLEEE